jgi:hypothetical protein
MNDATTEQRPADPDAPPSADNSRGNDQVGAGGPQRRPSQHRPHRDGRRSGPPGPGGTRSEPREGTFPFELTTIRLNHGATITAFDRSFDRFRNSFYHVTAVLQRLHLDDGIDLVQAYLEHMVDEALRALREGKREVLAALEGRTGSREYRLMVPRPEEREARVPSYTCRQFLEVFRELDDYLSAVAYAESVGAISWRDRRTLFMNAPRHATSVAGRFQGVATRLSVHDLQQAASAIDALKAIVASADGLPSLQEARSLVVDHTVEGSPAEAAADSAVVLPPTPDEPALAAPPEAAAPEETAGRKRRKGNSPAGAALPAIEEGPAESGWL